MKLVFEAPIANKAKLALLLEADPYAEKSFSRNGYKVKDGALLGQDKELVFVFMNASEEFAAFAKEKLKELASTSKPDVAEAVAKKIQEEENSAEVGFGAIFG